MRRLITITIMLIVTAATLTGCFFYRENPYPYRGEYKELYTAAIYSIPDAVGYMHHGEGAYNSAICVWEQDDYGRTLFSYCEDYSDQIFGLVVCQSYDETNVYFYPDDNYILTLIESEYCYEGVEKDHLKKKRRLFTQRIKKNLKQIMTGINLWINPNAFRIRSQTTKSWIKTQKNLVQRNVTKY